MRIVNSARNFSSRPGSNDWAYRPDIVQAWRCGDQVAVPPLHRTAVPAVLCDGRETRPALDSAVRFSSLIVVLLIIASRPALAIQLLLLAARRLWRRDWPVVRRRSLLRLRSACVRMLLSPRTRAVVAAVLITMLSSVEVQAEIIVPSGLSPGDKYHLAFVTRGTRDGTSGNVADYNAFVQSQAELSGSITELYGISWSAIASTGPAHARTNAFIEGPVYLLDGNKIADGLADMWDSSLLNPLNIDQFGDLLNTAVWTGSQTDGFTDPLTPLGSSGPTQADSSVTYFNWIDAGAGPPSSSMFSLYAVSETLVVPEPGTLVLSVGAAICTFFLARLKRWSHRTRRSECGSRLLSDVSPHSSPAMELEN